MADKKKAGVGVVPELVSGEQPTADKFNSIGVQLERASSELEKSVGDIWGESWPYMTSSNTKLTLPFGRKLTSHGAVAASSDAFLDIANIARIIGSASNLNPIVAEYSSLGDPVYAVEEEVLTDGTEAVERKEFSLKYPPLDVNAVTLSGTFAASMTRQVASHRDVAEPGDWCLSSNRKFTTFEAVTLGSSLSISYETVPVAWGTGPDVPGSTWNVIPDPNQMAQGGAGCTAAVYGSGYLVTLPLASHGKLNYDGTSSSLNGASDLSFGNQLTLPRVLQDNFTAGDIVPEGFLYLRDNNTGKLYSDAVYEYNNETNIIVKNVELEPSHTFTIITVGASITEALYDLKYKWFHHSHDGTYGAATVHVGSLSGIIESENDSGVYVESSIPNNSFPQYLHRDGFRSDSIANDGNSLRGNLAFGMVGEGSGNHIHGLNGITTTNSSTWGFCFGGNPGEGAPTNTYGPVIYGSSLPGFINLKILSADDSRSKVNIEGPGAFRVSMDRTVSQTAEEEFSIVSTSSYVDINAATLFSVTSAGGGTIDTESDLSLTSQSGNATTEVSSEKKIILDCKDWDSTAFSGILVCDSNSTTGTSKWNESIFDVRAPNNDGGVANIDNTTSNTSGDRHVLRLRYSQLDSTQIDYANFITFHASNRRVGRVESRPFGATPDDAFFSEEPGPSFDGGVGRDVLRQGDVAYISGSQDFGEAIHAGDLAEWQKEVTEIPPNNILGLPEGMVVYVREKNFWRQGPGTPMVVTKRAAFIGNLCDETETAPYEVLSFIGQVPVWTLGSVSSGDYLVPHEGNCCIAISPEEISFAQYKQAVGTAWESSLAEEGHRRVLCAIGVK